MSPVNLKKINLSDLIVILLFSFVLLFSIFYFHQARQWIGKEFPGFVVYENNIVGAFNQFEWNGTKQGLKNHDYIVKKLDNHNYQVLQKGIEKELEIKSQTFTLGEFLKVFCLPFFAGFIFLTLSLIIYWMMRGMAGAIPFFLFNLGVSYYLIASFDFHTSHHLSWLFLLNFALLPAYMTTFALTYPESPPAIEGHKNLLVIPSLISVLIAVPYIYIFYNQPPNWPFWEGVVVVYASLSYLFWIFRLAKIASLPRYETSRVTAKYLLVGQLIAFIIPLILAVNIFIFNANMPLNLAAPVTVVFPIAALFGMTFGRLKRTQMELVQSEKMASLGQLLAGVAHEINNPTNFIYSNLSPLKEYISYLKENVSSSAPKYRNELTSGEVFKDLDSLVSDIEEGANRTKQIVSDLRSFGHSQEETVSDVNVLEGIQSTLNLLKHEWSGRIQINLSCPPHLILKANPGQIAQIWMNLLGNAIHAIEGEGEIWVTAKQETGKIIVSIKDTGMGIESSKLKKIFDPFYTTKEQGVGTGLGLSIVQQIVKKWNGEIEVKSELGKGTEFILNFKY